jgi:hypothetical protein
MNNSIRLFLLLLFFITSCKKDEKTNIPQGVLNHDVMVKVMSDIHLAKGARMAQLLPDEYTKNPDKMLQDILLANHTDTSTFNTSWLFYNQHPEMMENIYKDVAIAIEKISVTN